MKYSNLSFFQNNGRPSWICGAYSGTTNEEYLVVFITVQNLVGIVAVVLIIRKCEYFARLVTTSCTA